MKTIPILISAVLSLGVAKNYGSERPLSLLMPNGSSSALSIPSSSAGFDPTAQKVLAAGAVASFAYLGVKTYIAATKNAARIERLEAELAELKESTVTKSDLDKALTVSATDAEGHLHTLGFKEFAKGVELKVSVPVHLYKGLFQVGLITKERLAELLEAYKHR
jgi:hypothetical protein